MGGYIVGGLAEPLLLGKMEPMDILRGTIERITYHHEENGYTVAPLLPDGQALLVPWSKHVGHQRR
jgi:hypothetical protein